MSHLAIYLFGGFQAELDGNPIIAFGTDKQRALLAYLALESKRPHRREALATLLWCKQTESMARNSLRQALFQLRRSLHQAEGEEPYLLITPNQVQFNPASDHWIDAVDFKRGVSMCWAHHQDSPDLCAGCLERLKNAVELYQGDLLEGFTLQGCSQFSEWQIISQEACHNLALDALSRLADYFETCLDYDKLIACTQRKIEMEPWRESAYRRQMWALAMKGQRERALQLYETLREVLQHELKILPVNETIQLVERIRAGDLRGTNSMG